MNTDPHADAIRLMTLHHGKGLSEFTAVFMVGMEEDLLPHSNIKDNAVALEEERRLCYVGMTRAKDYLFLSASRLASYGACLASCTLLGVSSPRFQISDIISLLTTFLKNFASGALESTFRRPQDRC